MKLYHYVLLYGIILLLSIYTQVLINVFYLSIKKFINLSLEFDLEIHECSEHNNC